MMIDHSPWTGRRWRDHGIAIVGYSHYHGDEQDRDSFTTETVEQVIHGRLTDRYFFGPVRSYFSGLSGFVADDRDAFWNNVMFFNYLPRCVGPEDQRYENGTPKQIDRAQRRFIGMIKQYRPKKVLVFTTKGWVDFPATLEEETGRGLGSLGAGLPKFTWGTYDAGGATVIAFGLRHPERAPPELMRRAVKAAVEFQLPERYSV